MKLLKKLAIFATALTLCLSASALVTACKDGDNSSSSSVESSAENSVEATANAYTFIILNKDGTPAKDVNVQLCMLGNSGACFMPVLTDAAGRVEYTSTPGEGEYEIHLFSADMAKALEFDGPTTTTATFSTITLTLK